MISQAVARGDPPVSWVKCVFALQSLLSNMKVYRSSVVGTPVSRLTTSTNGFLALGWFPQDERGEGRELARGAQAVICQSHPPRPHLLGDIGESAVKFHVCRMV